MATFDAGSEAISNNDKAPAQIDAVTSVGPAAPLVSASTLGPKRDPVVLEPGQTDVTDQGDGGVLKTLISAAPKAKAADVDASLKTTPVKGDVVSVNYTGMIAPRDGSKMAVFDSTTDIEFSRGHGALSFPVGQGSVVQGFDLAVLSMQAGETARFWIREEYGYGPRGCPGQGTAPDIEPFDDLVFEITLESVGEVSDVLQKAADRVAEDLERLKLLRQERQEAEEKAKSDAADKAAKKKAKADAKAAEKEKAAASSGGSLTAKEIKSMNPKKLKAELKLRGQSIEGNKKVLTERLLAAVAGA